MKTPRGISARLKSRKGENAYRELAVEPYNAVDFSSNDYLGFANSSLLFSETTKLLKKKELIKNGATGSRLITGNSGFYEAVEQYLAGFHQAESALLFNSGYDANLGFFSSVPQRNDIVFYDELIHASIRDGIRLGNAKALKFKHNNLTDLQQKIQRYKNSTSEIYVVTESVFSMDGDTPNLVQLTDFCEQNNVFLIVDEAHAVGIFGKKGRGIIQELNLEHKIFARIVTFGKALGTHGAAVLGSSSLREFLINFARSFIYTTALPPHNLAAIYAVYTLLENTDEIEKLHQNIRFFKQKVQENNLQNIVIASNSAICSFIIPGNKHAKQAANYFQTEHIQVKAILSPTVPVGQERLRFCIHSFNTSVEIEKVFRILKKILS